jgi:hypothetical protein
LLSDSGLHVPTFICFESPIPGTPHFQRLARREATPFLPNAMLRDFTGYTLVLEPAYADAAAFVDAYRKLIDAAYSWRNRGRKLMDDLPRFLRNGHWFPAAVDIADVLAANPAPAAARTLLAGSDTPPPERVPFEPDDFDSAIERRRVLEPWLVTDGSGRVLDRWLETSAIYSRNPHPWRRPRLSVAAGTAA